MIINPRILGKYGSIYNYYQFYLLLHMIFHHFVSFIINMLIILVVFSLIAKSDSQIPDSCFYSQRFTFFKGNTVASPDNPSGYNFNVSWEFPQPSIINSSIFFTVARSQRAIPLNYQASVVSTTLAGGTVMINPTNGSQILVITMNIVLLKSCSAIARLMLVQFNSIFLSNIYQNLSFNTGITFSQNIQNYKSEIFVTDFDGYPINGSTAFAFHSQLKPIFLNTNIQSISIIAITGPWMANHTFINRIRYTYIVIDIATYLITPITQNHNGIWASGQEYINIAKDFQPFADKKCMLGMKTYILSGITRLEYNLSLLNSTNYSQIYRIIRGGGNMIPTLLCIGFCKKNTGRSITNVCIPCPQFTVTCSNLSYALTCTPGYYLQPTVVGAQKCIYCMMGCRICTNYSYCIECEPTNLPTEYDNCQNCPINSHLAGGICSSVPGCSRAQVVNGRSICRSCSLLEYFQMDPINEKCVCKKDYELKDGKCVDYCGDGIIIDQECDDNNTANSDGCSSQCKQQKGYKCSRNTSVSPSQCFFIEKIAIELVSVKRVSLQNRIQLVFIVLPSYFTGLKPEFIKGSLQTNLSVDVLSATVQERFINVQMIFDEDIEDKEALFKLRFNDPSVIQNQVSLIIRFKSDQKLLKLQRIQLVKIIKYLFFSFLILAYFVLLVSIPFHKMIGLETIIPFQIIYFVFILTQEKTQLFNLFQYYAGSSLNFLFYFNGSSLLQKSPSDNTIVSNNWMLIFYSNFSIFFISLIGFIIHFLNDKQAIWIQRIVKFTKFWHNRISFPLFTLSMTPLLIFKSFMQLNKDSQHFHRPFLILQYFLMILVVSYQWRGTFYMKSSFIQSNVKYSSYIPIVLWFLLTISLLLTFSFIGIISFVEYWLFSLSLIFLIVFIYIRPYEGALNNAGVIVGMLQLVFFLGWGVIRRINNSMTMEQNQILGLLVCFALAAATTIVGIFRVIFQATRQCRQRPIQQLKQTKDEFKQVACLQARYQPEAILTQQLHNNRVQYIQTVPFQLFKPINKKNDSQLKKYLIQQTKKIKLAFQH